MINLKNQKIMNKKKEYSSIDEIRLDKARLRYKSLLYTERLKNSSSKLFSGFSFSMKTLSFNIRNRFLTYSFLRSLYKTNFYYDFIKNFRRGFKQAG